MSDPVDFEDLKPMSQNAFAKFAGVSAKQASVWKTKGYLDFTKEGLVDTQPSMITLMERGLGNFSHVQDGNTSTDIADLGVTSQPASLPTSEEEADQIIGELAKAVGDFKVAGLLSYAESERLERYFYALRIRLIYEKDAGKLVDRSEIEAEFSTVLADIRQSWENWPSSVCGEMAQELGVNQRKLWIVLEKYVRSQITAYVTAMEAEDDDDDDESED